MSDEAGTNTGDNTNVNTNDDGNDGKVFTQSQIDDIVNKTYSKAYAKANTKVNAESKVAIDALKEEIAELKVESGNKKSDEGQNADLTALTSKVEAMQAELTQANKRASRASLKSVASEQGAVNGEQVAMLIGSYIKYDGDKTTIVNAAGQTKFTGEGKEMTVPEFVKEFLHDNPHLVKASGNGGSGSRGSKGGGKNDGGKVITRGEYDKMTPIKQSEYVKSGGTLID